MEKNIGIQKSAGKVKKFNYWYLLLQKIEFKKHDTPVALIRNDLIVAVLPTHNSQQKPLRHKLCPTKHAQYHNTVENSSVRQGAKTFKVFLKSNCDTIQNSYF